MKNEANQGASVPTKTASEPVARLELSEHLPYLIRHVYAQLEAASAGGLARFGLNVAVWRILAVLWQHGDLAHRELAELTSIEVSTLSRVSKTVQRDGLIRRKRTVADQRTVRVTLTDKGRDLVRQIIPAAVDMQNQIIGNMTPKDVQTVTRLLHVIAENLGAYEETDFDVPKAPVKKVAKAAEPTDASARTISKTRAPRKRISRIPAA